MQKALAVTAALALACGGSSGDSRTLPDPGETNDTIEQSKPLPGNPAVIVATVARADDYDFWQVAVPHGGATVRFQTFDEGGVDCDPVNGTVDTFLEVYDAGGTLLAWSDDSGVNLCEDLSLALPAGTSHVAVSGYLYPSVYTLEVTVP